MPIKNTDEISKMKIIRFVHDLLRNLQVIDLETGLIKDLKKEKKLSDKELDASLSIIEKSTNDTITMSNSFMRELTGHEDKRRT